MTKCFRQFKNRKDLIDLVSSEIKASFEKTSSSAARPSWTAAPTSLWASSLAWEYQVLCWKTSSTLLKNIKYFVEEHPATIIYLENIKCFNLPSSKWCTRNDNIYSQAEQKAMLNIFSVTIIIWPHPFGSEAGRNVGDNFSGLQSLHTRSS